MPSNPRKTRDTKVQKYCKMDTNVTIQPLPLYVKQHMKKHCLENHTSPVRDRCVLLCHYSCFWLTSHDSAQSNAFVDFVINASIYHS